MKTSEIITNACARTGIAKKELAEKMGMFPSSLYRKLAKESMTIEELQACLEVLGVRLNFEICYPDGDTRESRLKYEQLIEKISLLEKELETAHSVAEFQQKSLKELRTELNSAVGYMELCKRHSAKTEEYLEKLKTVHTAMERTLAYSLGEPFDETIYEVDSETTQALEGLRVLLVDDHDMNREILRDELLEYGLLVEETDSGKKAISLITQNPPGYYQFILMDIEMPEQDGYETTMMIRKLHNRIRANTPIIALTANARAEDRKKAFASGMDDFLVKPAASARLLVCLAKFL